MLPKLKAVSALSLIVVGAGLVLARPAGAESGSFEYREVCDASAAIGLDADHFAVADDETNTLTVYQRGKADAVDSVDLAAFLGTTPKKETDLAAAAVIGNRIYWIASHSKNKAVRWRLFATDIVAGAVPGLAPAGTPDTGLTHDLIAAPQLAPYDVKAAAKRPAEDKTGLNIEGLAATEDGRLLIGFSSPAAGRQGVDRAVGQPGVCHRGRTRKARQADRTRSRGQGHPQYRARRL
ncbi:MAG TPA: hypothetical protein VMW57_03765 [Methyloceanibacter sp.]|nr:hypothetical protein [Methyloceanibacter sp.]